MSEPLARSPIPTVPPAVELSGWEVSGRRSGAALTLTDVSPLAKVHVRGTRVVDVPFGRAVRMDGLLVVGSGPDEWLVLGRIGSAGDLTRLPVEGFVSVLDVTHGRAMLRLTGAAAADLLAKVCAVDLADASTPNGAAFRSSVARVVTDVVRDDRGAVRSYLLHCERSSGQYLCEALLDAGAEFGIDTAGFDGTV